MPSITISPLNTVLISQLQRKAQERLEEIYAYRKRKWFNYVYDEVEKNKKWNRLFFGIKLFDTEYSIVERDLTNDSCYGSFVYHCIHEAYLYDEEVLKGIIEAIEYIPYGTALELTIDDLKVLGDEHILDRDD